MPVYLKPNPSHSRRRAASGKLFAERRKRPGDRLTIGLINNMADGALEATERQFVSLLNAASEGISVDLALYSLPGITRSANGSRHVEKYYSNAEDLLDTHIDGLIVTGREPLKQDMRDEAYWPSFTRILDWAKDHTHASVWSCLAAHAAVLHLDGIGRIRSENKFSGVYECERISGHALIASASLSFRIPHSRWNGLSEDTLQASGYEVLTREAKAGVDTFIKQNKSLFVFFQGHPEYESKTLLMEYRRDVGRFLRRESENYPGMPHEYFDTATVAQLRAIQQQAEANPSDELLAKVSQILEAVQIENTWNSTAVHIYRNWLQYMSAQKKRSLRENNTLAEQHPAADYAMHTGIAPIGKAETVSSALVSALEP
jgi:homoserine O-succinyltransferase/O-acetyltransferase